MAQEMGRARAESARALHGQGGVGSVGGEEYPEAGTSYVGAPEGYAGAELQASRLSGCGRAQSPTWGEATASDDEDHVSCELKNIYEDE